MPDPILIVMHQETSTPGRVGHALRKRGYALDMRRPRFGDALHPGLQKRNSGYTMQWAWGRPDVRRY